ncbi:MAG: LPP20 family lipoprotein [Campylobacterota bacterium]|nr:LPP20 family lipoprotein [Campylobacterota bacterium]
MKLKLSASILISSLLLIGCGSTPQPSKVISNSKKTITPKPIIKKTSPNWILNPNKQNHICAIGSSKLSSDKKTMKKIASMKAKANISKQIKIYIDSKSKASKNNNGKSTYTTSSTQQSTNMLRGVKVVDNYEDKQNNIFYLRTCTKI